MRLNLRRQRSEAIGRASERVTGAIVIDSLPFLTALRTGYIGVTRVVLLVHLIKRKARTNAGETCDAEGKADRESAGELDLFVCSGFTLNGGSVV